MCRYIKSVLSNQEKTGGTVMRTPGARSLKTSKNSVATLD
jgi:hypothetical protein